VIGEWGADFPFGLPISRLRCEPGGPPTGPNEGKADMVDVTAQQPTAAALSLEWWREPATTQFGCAIVTGVFDLLHVGHVRFLEAVRAKGRRLVVGVEDDQRTRAWKGSNRPFQPAVERAEILAALRAVDEVFLIHGGPDVVSWCSYASLLAPLRPAALAFTESDLYSAEKHSAARALGAQIWAIPVVPGHSTTLIAQALT
jgi:cytidyltransferase-like protein